MGARQMLWARKLRRKIMRELEYECTFCKATRHLQFDCKEPVGNSHGKWSYDTRIRFYREQLKEGNLQVLCSKCHDKKSAKERRKKHPEFHFDDDNTPF